MIRKITLMTFVMNLFSLAYSQIDFTKVTQTIGSDLKVVDIGDINNDGLDDIVIGAGFYYDKINDYHLFIYYQNVDGTLKNPIKIKYPSSYPGLVVLHIADINNDTLNDVVIGYADSIGIYFQNQQGNLEPIKSYYSGNDVDGLKTGDLNNDGLNDIAVCHWNDDFINVFYQTDVDTFNIVSYPFESAGRDDLEINDVNNDGLDDIIFMPGQGNIGTLHIFYQDSILGITDSVNTLNYVFEYSKTFNGIGTGDLNGDSKNDIVGTIGGNTAAIVLLMQDSINNIYNNPIQLSAYDIPTPVEINDLNCDCNNEIIVGHNGWGSVTIYQKDTTNTFNDYIRFQASFYYNPYSMAVGDINNDNKPDIVTVGSKEVVFLYNVTKPTIFSDIDTSIINQSIVIDTITSNNSYQVVEIDSTSDCHIKEIYNYQVSTITKHERQVGDSVFFRYGSICDNEYIDTLLLGFDYTLDTIISSDTVKTLLSTDTIIYDYHYSNSFVQIDTTDMWTELKVDTLRLEDITISNDTTIIVVDSVKVTNRTLYIEIIDSYFDIYKGIKCKQQYIDTILTNTNEKVDSKVIYTDTLLISQSIERYPSDDTSISNNTEKDLMLYPNPSHDYIRINYSGQSSTSAELTLLNLSGKVVVIERIDSLKNYKLDISSLQAGYYIVDIKLDDKRLVDKFIKE